MHKTCKQHASLPSSMHPHPAACIPPPAISHIDPEQCSPHFLVCSTTAEASLARKHSKPPSTARCLAALASPLSPARVGSQGRYKLGAMQQQPPPPASPAKQRSAARGSAEVPFCSARLLPVAQAPQELGSTLSRCATPHINASPPKMPH